MADYSEWSIQIDDQDCILVGPDRSTYLKADFTIQDVLDMIDTPKLSKSNTE